MPTFAETQRQPDRVPSAKAPLPDPAHLGTSSEAGSILHLQRTIGNQAVQKVLQSRAEERVRGQKPPKPEPPVPKPEEKPEPKPVPKPEEAKPKLTITHETTFAAPDGSDKARTDVGIGEKVTFKGSAVGKWTASKGLPTELASGAEFVWTAPDRAGDATIKLQVGTEEATVTMKVFEPDNIVAVRNSKIAIGAGTAGAGMKLTFNYYPKKVSFGNVKAKEVSGPATNIDGYYKKHYTAEELKHDSGDTFTSIKENNEDSAEDTAKTVDTFKPYEKGTFDWVIPNKFKVKTEAGDGKKFPSDVTQAFAMVDATGKIKITKAGAEVERSPAEP